MPECVQRNQYQFQPHRRHPKATCQPHRAGLSSYLKSQVLSLTKRTLIHSNPNVPQHFAHQTSDREVTEPQLLCCSCGVLFAEMRWSFKHLHPHCRRTLSRSRQTPRS